MDSNFKRTAQITAYLLIAAAVTQAVYTALRMADVAVPRQLLWGTEVLLFTILTAFAGAALAQAKNYHVGWSAIAFSAVLNVVQVSVGLTMFAPFREAAGQVEGLAPAAGAVAAFSFMVYNGAKLLLGFAALTFGRARMEMGAKALGGLTAAAGAIAMFANATVIGFGRGAFLPGSVAGGSGVVATLLLGICLLSVIREE